MSLALSLQIATLPPLGLCVFRKGWCGTIHVRRKRKRAERPVCGGAWCIVYHDAQDAAEAAYAEAVAEDADRMFERRQRTRRGYREPARASARVAGKPKKTYQVR